nr:MAG TPA: hypothetical protein [Caudoviricetes sp.]
MLPSCLPLLLLFWAYCGNKNGIFLTVIFGNKWI